MRTSILMGCAIVAAGALLVAGALVVAKRAQPRARTAARVLAVARCVAQAQQSLSCACMNGELRHHCLRSRWLAMRACRDGQGAPAPSGRIKPMLTVWCAPPGAALPPRERT